jgi:replicative DNA helicase
MNNSVLTIPHDFEAEQATIGRIIERPEELIKIISILSPNSFHAENHRHIFRAMLELFEKKQQIDEITLGDQLKEFGKLEDVGGYSYLAELVECSPVSGNIQYWAEIIKDDAMLRDLITITSDISRKARDPQQSVVSLLIDAETKIREIASRRSTDVQLLGDVLVECFYEMETLSETDNENIGIRLGFEDIDKLIGGLMPGDFMVIGARPGMGKSALLMNMINYVALTYGEPCLLYSREMQKTKLAKRALSSEGRISQYFLKTAKGGTEEDWDRLARTADRLQKAAVYLDDKTKQIDEMIYKCHALHAQHENGLKLITFDYLQKIIGAGQKIREQEISDISAKMKDLAMDLNVPVIALAQLNRDLEKRSDKRPQLSDLRESGAIEQDADVIGFIYRDEYYNPDDTKFPGIAEVDFPKVRDGATGMVQLRFEGKYTKFSSITKYQQPPL